MQNNLNIFQLNNVHQSPFWLKINTFLIHVRLEIEKLDYN